MFVLAHFTVHELPATFAIFIIGMVLGVWLKGRRLVDWMTGLLLGVWLIGLVVEVAADHSPAIARLFGAELVDVLWLLLTVMLLVRVWRLAAPARRRGL
jgi:hypothetical protein